MASRITIADLMSEGVKSQYLVICTETGKFYTVVFNDAGVLPDGHPHKTMAIASHLVSTLENAIMALLLKTDTILSASVVSMVVNGELSPPHPEMRPITLLSKTEWGTWILNSGFDSGLGNVFRKYIEGK